MSEDKGQYLEDLGFILLLIVLAVICLPIIAGLCVALLLGFSGMLFYGVTIFICTFLWCCLYLLWWL